MAPFTLCSCRAVPGRKGCVGTGSGAAPVATSASLMSGAATGRVTAQMAVTRLAVSNTLLLSPVSHPGVVGGCPAQREVGMCLCRGKRPCVLVASSQHLWWL